MTVCKINMYLSGSAFVWSHIGTGIFPRFLGGGGTSFWYGNSRHVFPQHRHSVMVVNPELMLLFIYKDDYHDLKLMHIGERILKKIVERVTQ